MRSFYLYLNAIILQPFIYCIHIKENKTQINRKKCVFLALLKFGDIFYLKVKHFEEKYNVYGSHSRDRICTFETKVELFKYSVTLARRSLGIISICFLKNGKKSLKGR